MKREVLSEVQQISIYIINPILRIVQAIPTLLVTLAGFIFLTGFNSLFYILILLGICSFLFLIIKKPFARLGLIRFQTNEVRFKFLEIAFSNIRLIKILSLRDKFIKRYSLNYKKYAKVQSLSQIISQLPKFVLEILFISICAIMLTTNFIDLSFQEKFPIIVAGAYKLVPIFSLMVQNVSRLIYGRKPLEEIIDRHSSLKKSKKLKIINKINDSKSKLITNFSALPSHSIKLNRKKVTEIHLEAFKVTVITGASGAGKTTLIDQLTSLKKKEL